MICSYLVEVENWQIEGAISEFEKQREPGIYKQHYIESLLKKYDGDLASMEVPALPDWDLDEEDGEEEMESSSNGKRKREDGHYFNSTEFIDF